MGTDCVSPVFWFKQSGVKTTQWWISLESTCFYDSVTIQQFIDVWRWKMWENKLRLINNNSLIWKKNPEQNKNDSWALEKIIFVVGEKKATGYFHLLSFFSSLCWTIGMITCYFLMKFTFPYKKWTFSVI